MKILTVCQPYAHLIASGAKRVENRTWPTDYRGPILIHAGKSRQWLELSDDGTRDEEYGIPLASMAFGAVVAVADLLDCVSISRTFNGLLFIHRRYRDRYPWLADHEHTEGPVCWILGNVRPLAEPIVWRGQQGLREADEGLVERVRAQLEGTEVRS